MCVRCTVQSDRWQLCISRDTHTHIKNTFEVWTEKQAATATAAAPEAVVNAAAESI